MMSEAARVQRLEPPEPPEARVRVVVDTDAANEIDDQFALTYAVLCQDRLAIEAVYAAPFQRYADPVRGAGRHGRDPADPYAAATPAQGMAQSQAEIVRVLAALGEAAGTDWVHPGSQSWLPGPRIPVPSPAADDLVRRARAGADPLYVLTLGAPTNVASALLSAPGIAENLVVVWLGGNGTWWSPGAEYNVYQDLNASRVLLDSGVPLVHVPCYQVTEKLLTTREEIERRVRGRGRIGDYLADLYAGFAHDSARMKQLWDIGPVAWVVQPRWCPSVLVASPILHDDLTWGHDPARHLIREVRDIDADAVLEDLFNRLPSP
jgi:inosine-uridine nucleoside N-ribohydrolase